MNSPEMVAAKRGNPLKKFWGNKPWQRLLKLLKPQCNRSSAETQGNAAWPGSARIGHTVEREDTPAIRGMINGFPSWLKLRSKRCV